MPATFPRNAHEANVMCVRNRVRIDARTHLVRMGGNVHMQFAHRQRRFYRGNITVVREDILLAEWMPNGALRIDGGLVSDARDIAGLRRLNAILPPEWTVEYRGRHMRPRLLFRGVYPLSDMSLTFHTDGSIKFSGPYGERITLELLHDEADEREGLTARPRRSVPHIAQGRLVSVAAEADISAAAARLRETWARLPTWTFPTLAVDTDTPTCDHCGFADDGVGWNGETGNHIDCEQIRDRRDRQQPITYLGDDEPTPTCDLCGYGIDDNWNGDTGNHIDCEVLRDTGRPILHRSMLTLEEV